MHPLTAAEQGDAFQLADSLRYGNLPARFSEDNPARYLKDYVQTYLREEVLQEGLTRNIGHFTRFLEAASFSQGALINISAVARDCQVYFWRTKSGLEVDFVLYGDNGLIAIEVKRTPRLDKPDLRALREFKQGYPPARCFVFYGGTIRQYFDEIVAIPLQDALKELDSILSATARRPPP